MHSLLTIADQHLATARLSRPGVIAALLLSSLWISSPVRADIFPSKLFGYYQSAQPDKEAFSQWQNMLQRQSHSTPTDWQAFLNSIHALPREQQLEQVNRYFNKAPYVEDSANYRQEDYWATPQELLHNGGDCEDYAIAKMFALRSLDYPAEQLRLVVLQYTALQLPHAVLAVANGDDILILDNQNSEVLSHQELADYTPVYSINEQQWWLHTPVEVATDGFVQAGSTVGSIAQTDGN